MRNVVIFGLLLFIVFLGGCSNKPDNEIILNTSYNGMKSFFPSISRDAIQILKTYEDGANTVAVVQAGDAICELPFIESQDGWINRGINCNGAYVSPEQKIKDEKSKFYQRLRVYANTAYLDGPLISEDNSIQVLGLTVEEENEMIILDHQFLNIKLDSKTEEEWNQQMALYVTDFCTNELRMKAMKEINVNFTDNYQGSDGVPIFYLNLNREVCSEVWEELGM